jgi:hypothetical protein
MAKFDDSHFSTLTSCLCFSLLLFYLLQRGSRGGGGRARAAPARRPAAVPARRPASTSTPAPAQAQSGGMMSGLGSTIMQGMAFGTGSAMAHRAVGAVAGSMGGGGSEEESAAPMDQQQQYAPQQAQQQLQGACGQDKQMFFECLQVNKGDQQACSFLYDSLQSCQREQNQMQFS